MRRAATAALSERGYILADGTGSDLRDGLVSPIGGLLAAVQRLVFLQLGLSDPLRGLGLFDLDREFADRALEIVASGDRGSGVGGISKVLGIADPGALFLGGDFAVEIGGHSREFGDHHFDLANASPLFLDLEAFQPDERVPRFHTNALPTTKQPWGATPPISDLPRDHTTMPHESCFFVTGSGPKSLRASAEQNFRVRRGDVSGSFTCVVNNPCRRAFSAGASWAVAKRRH